MTAPRQESRLPFLAPNLPGLLPPLPHAAPAAAHLEGAPPTRGGGLSGASAPLGPTPADRLAGTTAITGSHAKLTGVGRRPGLARPATNVVCHDKAPAVHRTPGSHLARSRGSGGSHTPHGKTGRAGLASTDRNNKTTLLFTAPGATTKSYAKVLTPRIVKLQDVSQRRGLPPRRRCQPAEIQGRSLFVSDYDVRERSSRSGMDSDLEAFSHYPADGSFAALPGRTAAKTNYLKPRFLSY